MRKLLLRLWRTTLDEFSTRNEKLKAFTVRYGNDIRNPLVWFRPTLRPPPFDRYIAARTYDYVNEVLDHFEETLGVLPALIISHVLLSEMSIDPILKQRVMTLDQVALFPARMIIDLGLRNVMSGSLPREFEVQQAGAKLEKFFAFFKTGSLKHLKGLIFGSLWARIVRIGFLCVKWAQTAAYVALLYRYVSMLENRSEWSLLFNAVLSDKAPRKKMRVSIRRRVGGVKP